MSVEHALKSILNNMARTRRTERRNAAPLSTESLEARTLLTLIGTNAVLVHTVQVADVGSGLEQPFGPQGNAVVADDAADPEFASFAGQYDIDIDANRISMTWNSATAPGTNTATTRRYYFSFDLASNETISSVSASTDATLQPNVSVDGNTVIVEITPGMQIGDGFDALINVDVQRTGTVITGRKYHDANNDGDQDPGELFLNGWTVELRDIDADASDAPIATTTTQDIDLDGSGTIEPETESGRYVFSDVPAGTYVVQEVIPTGWTQSQPNHPNSTAAFELDTALELSSTGNDFLNWGGLNEKWFYSLAGTESAAPQSPSAWYYVVPDGSIFQWDGSPQTALTGTLVVQLDASFYADPSLIYNAPTARQYIADVDVSVPATFRGLHFGNYLPATAFEITGDQETNSATLTWTAVEDATYDVWVSDIAAGQQFRLLTDLTGTQVTITDLPDRSYRVWLKVNSRGVSSPWSAPQQVEFFRDPINLITSDRATTIDATPTIEWRSLAGASSYDIRVTRGEQTVYLQNDIAELSHRVANPLQFGVDYRVAVRANFSDGSQTAWDQGLPIRLDGRTTPVVTGTLVTWAPVAAATGYEIWVNRYDEAGVLVRSQAVSTIVTDATSFTLPALQRGDHSIWIRAIRAEGTQTYKSFWGPRTDFFFVAAEPTEDAESPLLQLASVTTALDVQATQAVAAVPPIVPADARQSDDSDAAAEIEIVMADLASSDFLDEA